MAEISSGMKSETLDEARERFAALTEAEKQGAAAASEGILVPEVDPAVEDRIAEVNEHGAELQRLFHSRGEVVVADADNTEENQGEGRASRRSSRRTGGRKSKASDE